MKKMTIGILVLVLMSGFISGNLCAGTDKGETKTITSQLLKRTGTKELVILLMEIKQTQVGDRILMESVIYQVVLDENGKKLIPFIDKTVKVTGITRKIKGKWHIKVKKFQQVKE